MSKLPLRVWLDNFSVRWQSWKKFISLKNIFVNPSLLSSFFLSAHFDSHPRHIYRLPIFLSGVYLAPKIGRSSGSDGARCSFSC